MFMPFFHSSGEVADGENRFGGTKPLETKIAQVDNVQSRWSLCQCRRRLHKVSENWIIHRMASDGIGTTYIPLIYCQLGDYMLPTTY